MDDTREKIIAVVVVILLTLGANLMHTGYMKSHGYELRYSEPNLHYIWVKKEINDVKP